MLSRHGDRGVRQSLCLVAQHGLILSTVQHGTHIVAHTAVHTHIGADTGDVLHGTHRVCSHPRLPHDGTTRLHQDTGNRKTHPLDIPSRSGQPVQQLHLVQVIYDHATHSVVQHVLQLSLRLVVAVKEDTISRNSRLKRGVVFATQGHIQGQALLDHQGTYG